MVSSSSSSGGEAEHRPKKKKFRVSSGSPIENIIPNQILPEEFKKEHQEVMK